MKKILLAVALLTTDQCGSASAVDFFWSADGATQGGVGTWNTTNARFGASAAGPFTTVWNNVANANDTAVFGGTAGAVTVGASITVNSLTFNTGGYSLAAGSTITFAGANPTITVNVTGTPNTTISAVYTGTSQITKMGTGRLELNASTNTNAGGYKIQEGFINLAAANRLGTGAANPGSLDADWFVFAGGGLTSSNAASQDLGANRGVTLAGKAWLGASAATNPVVVSAPITGTGDFIVANATTVAVNGGSASPLNTSFNAGGVWILSNTANNWTGDAQVGAGTLRMGASNVIPDTSVVHLTNSGVQFDLNTNTTTETVKSISGTAGTIAIGGGSLTVADPNGQSSASVLTSTAAGKFIKNGSGALTLTGSSTGFLGEFVLNSGTIGVGGANSLGSGAGAQLTINGGNLSNNSTSARNVSANLSVNLNADFTVDDSLAATPGQINLQGAATIKNTDRTITVNGTGILALGGVVGEDAAGRSLNKAGVGTLILTNAANTYSGNTTVSAGTLQVDGDGSLGNGAGTVNLAGGALNAGASRTVATPNPINVNGNSAITTTSAAAAPEFNFSTNTFGGDGTNTLTLRNDGADETTDTFRVRLSGSGFNFANPIDIQNGAVGKTELQSTNTSGTQTFSGVISGNGGYTRQQAGTTVLTAANTYSGATIINSGTVYANNASGSATGSGAVTVNGGTLGGTGIVTGNVTVESGGAVAPGASIESLDLTGTLTFNDANVSPTVNSSFVYEIDSSTVMADLLNVTGNITLADQTNGGTSLVTSDLAVADQNIAGTKFTLIGYAGSLTGTFAGLPNGGYIIGLGLNDWQIDYADVAPGVNGGTGSLFVTITAAVPEASSVLFGALASCVGVVTYVVRRRRKG